MGYPVNTFVEFEHNVKHSSKGYTIIIFANAHSDSRAVEFIINNFHMMDTLSDDVDFYLPGYRAEDIDEHKKDETDINENKVFHHFLYDYHDTESYTREILLGRSDTNRKFIKVIDSPRLGPIRFNDAAYTDFVLEMTRRCKHYNYLGTCQMNLIPIEYGKPVFSQMRSYDLDAVIDCPSGDSLESFFFKTILKIRQNHELRYDIISEIDNIYMAATRSILHNEKQALTISNVIADIERCLQWSLDEEFYFISYSSRNVMMATMIGRALHSRGCNVWIAPDGIPQGREYSLVIPTTLKRAKNFVLLLTRDSANSQWVRRELDFALNNHKFTKIKVIVGRDFSIDRVIADDELRFLLNRVQIKYQYDDIMKDMYILDKFIRE